MKETLHNTHMELDYELRTHFLFTNSFIHPLFS